MQTTDPKTILPQPLVRAVRQVFVEAQAAAIEPVAAPDC